MQLRDQQHIFDVAGDQRLPQLGRFGVVGPGHPGRHQVVAGGNRALLGTQDRGDDVFGCARGAEPSTAVMSKTSWSMMTPSAFSPSTSAMLTFVGVIDTPSTISTRPSKHSLLGIFGSPRERVPRKPESSYHPVAADHFRTGASAWLALALR